MLASIVAELMWTVNECVGYVLSMWFTTGMDLLALGIT